MTRFRISGVTIAAILGLCACGSDEDVNLSDLLDASSDTSRSASVSLGTFPLDTDGTLTDDLCPWVRDAVTLDYPCGPEIPCEVGAVCVDLGVGPRCTQGCIPNTCTDRCTSDERCVSLLAGDGSPAMSDANGDGVGDFEVGVCTAKSVPGTNGEYDACGANGGCLEDLTCIGRSAEAAGTCLRVCEGLGNCDVFGDFTPRCSTTTTEINVCLINCDDGGACPEGTTCTPVAHNHSACLR